MTTVVEKSIVVKATPDEVDAVTLDGNLLPQWYAGVQSVELEGAYPDPGGAVKMVYRSAGINFKMSMTSLRLVKGESLLLKLDGMITGKSRWFYTPEGDDTRVSCRFEYEMPGGSIGQAVNKLVVERMNVQNLEKSLEDLKALVESRK
ncbi:MAG: SRPBCC family protein [Ardenticatenaceae bacterium]|nr:SRPBCC family protein [Ardenticatenaceae bacterium]